MRTKAKNLIVSLFVITSLLGCSAKNQIVRYNYRFADSPFRDIIINLKSDSTFVMRNAVTGDLAYSFVGNWTRIDDKSILLVNPNPMSGDSLDNAPKLGERIDVKSAFSNRSYIFPTLERDTIHFQQNYRRFTLRGYEFVKSKRFSK
jgi:hypothetical protein